MFKTTNVISTTQEDGNSKSIKLLSAKQIQKKIGISNTQFYDRYKKLPGFPKAVEFFDGKPRWIEYEIDNWILSYRDSKTISPQGGRLNKIL